jgi:hypothetical protein
MHPNDRKDTTKAKTQDSVKKDSILALLQVKSQEALHKKMHNGRYSKTSVS